MHKRIVKVFGIFFTTLCLLVVGGISYLVMTVDNETIKGRVVQYVYKKTGRDLKIIGGVGWSLFPWLGIKMQDVSLSNKADFSGDVFAKAKKVEVSIKMMPLVFGDIEVGNIALKDFALFLVRDKFGVGNWQDIFISDSKSNRSSNSSVEKGALKKIKINLVRINNGFISLDDKVAGAKKDISDLNLTCKNINFGKPFSVVTSFVLKDLDLLVDNKLNIESEVIIDFDKKTYAFDQMQIVGKIKNMYASKPFSFKSNINGFLDLNKQSFSVGKFNTQVSTIRINGSLQGEKIIDNPDLFGSLSAYDSNPKKTMRMFGLYRYPKNFTRADLKSKFRFVDGVMKIGSIKASLGDMKLKANVKYTKNLGGFDLYLNKFNFDSFSGKNPKSILSKYDKADNGSIVKISRNKSDPKVPLGFLQKINLFGRVGVGSIVLGNLKLANFNANIDSDKKSIEVKKMGFDFYKGQVSGKGSYDLSSSSNMRANLSFKDIQMNSLLKDFVGYDKFKGMLNLNATVDSKGGSKDEVLNNLNGFGKVNVMNGSYQGVDIPYEVRKAHAIINSSSMPQKTDPQHTKFDTLNMGFNINSGVLSTSNFLIDAVDYKVIGKGDANLVLGNLDLSLSAYSKNDKNFYVPVKIKGGFSDPSISLDVPVLLKNKVVDTVKDVIQDQLGKHIENFPQELKKILPF